MFVLLLSRVYKEEVLSTLQTLLQNRVIIFRRHFIPVTLCIFIATKVRFVSNAIIAQLHNMEEGLDMVHKHLC